MGFNSEFKVLKCLLNHSNICPTRYNVTQFRLSGNCSTCFGWYHHPSSGAQTSLSTASGICHTAIAAGGSNGIKTPDPVGIVVCAPDDGWWYHTKYLEQFPDKINRVTLHLVGYILEYSSNARIHKR
jgi:hypothetical protein